MHELGIIFHVIKDIEAVGKENKLKKVNAVTLEIGEVSGVVESYMTDCWRWAADKSDLLRGSQLVIDTIPAVTVCDECGQNYETVKHGRTCPYCQSENTHLVAGNEMNIKEIEAC
ncbi:MAG: hydrogenase maturation nickel metallochaperone HypA [Clostridia bacterium]|nr:hydrogenase maturation nickel metallochaperone HypA [Clostridia bacterium]NLS85512.1 hydrogenase maturation nickel metallochaperone HypA [Oscillospiraceae bacterium]